LRPEIVQASREDNDVGVSKVVLEFGTSMRMQLVLQVCTEACGGRPRKRNPLDPCTGQNIRQPSQHASFGGFICLAPNDAISDEENLGPVRQDRIEAFRCPIGSRSSQ
jgi:hypothetical protein